MIVVHVGKCGGSNLYRLIRENHNDIKFQTVHVHNKTIKSYPDSKNIVILIRDPVKRFLSVYKSWYCIINKIGNFKNSPHHERAVKNFKKYYDFFKNPNQLAESLTSNDMKIKDLAIEAINTIQHMNDSINSYLCGVEYLEQIKDNIKNIIRQEYYQEDFLKFYDNYCQTYKIEKKDLDFDTIRNNCTKCCDNILDTTLSELGTKNIRDWYIKDYDCIRFLCENNLTDPNYINTLI